MANRINYFFKSNGISTKVDSGCSSTVYAINDLFHALKRNECDCAIVASAILIENPITLQELSRYIVPNFKHNFRLKQKFTMPSEQHGIEQSVDSNSLI